LGYANNEVLTRQFSGQLVEFPNPTFGDDGLSMTLQARGSMWFGSRVSTTFDTKGKTILQTLRYIASSYGSDVYYLDKDGKAKLIAGQAPTALSKLNETLNELMKGNDFILLRDLITKRAGYLCFIDGSKIVVFNPAEQAYNEVVPTFEYRGGVIDVQRGIFPIISIGSLNSQLPFAAATGRVVTVKDDVVSDEPPQEDLMSRDDRRITDSQVSLRKYSRPDSEPNFTTSTGGQVYASFKAGDRPDSAGLQVPLTDTDPAGEAKLAYLKRLGETQGGLQIEFETLAIPTMNPGIVADVKGLTALYSGKYLVQTLKFGYSADGLSMSVSGFTPGGAAFPTTLFDQLSQSTAPDAKSAKTGGGTTFIKTPDEGL
jgi:hypothetical protein